MTVKESVPWLPAASTAVIVITFEPATSGMAFALQLVVPAAVPLLPLSLAHRTCTTPMLSEAEPPSEIDAVVVE